MTEDKLTKAREEINEIDKEMASLFSRRMEAVKQVAEYKKENNLPILDEAREGEVIKRNSRLVCDELRSCYVDFLKNTMSISRGYQGRLTNSLYVNLGDTGYTVSVGRGFIKRAGELFNLKRRVLVLTDSGVPKEYAECVLKQCQSGIIMTVNEGESAKSLDTLGQVISEMMSIGMTRGDSVIAVGGGVVGDLAGFAAASYMRGIDFYNIPTTLLSQVDSSIGGKTAINHNGIKNAVGAFYQPKGVIVDPDLLSTLPKRQFANGMAEAVKMAVTLDAGLFELIEKDGDVEEIIRRSIELKRDIVESDERESGIRRVLNFGHTLGHAIEACDGRLYHGECVALGMLYASSDEVRERLIPLLDRLGLPTSYDGDIRTVSSRIMRDKKRMDDSIYTIFADVIGNYRIEKQNVESLISRICEEKI